MKQLIARIKTKTKMLALTASGLIVGLFAVGLSAGSASAQSISYTGPGSYNSISSYSNGYYSNYNNHYVRYVRYVPQYRWVWNSYYHQYVLVVVYVPYYYYLW